MSPDWQYRYYSFNAKWDKDEMMASMTDSCGDNFYILFNAHGAILKGFDHENVMSPWSRDDHSLWPGMFDGVPPQFAQFFTEPAFEIPDTTFCIWRLNTDDAWHGGVTEFPDDDDGSDGSEGMLSIFTTGPESYREFAQGYYEKDISLEFVRRVYNHDPLTDELVRGLNPDLTLSGLRKDLDEIAYPGQNPT